MSGNGDVGVGFDVRFNQLIEVHAIEVIAGEDQKVVRLDLPEVARGVSDRIRRSLVPLFGGSKLWWNREYELTPFIGENIPAQANVPVQRIRFVLGENANSFQL